VSASTLTSGLSDTDSDTVADDLAVGATANGTATYTIQAAVLGTSIVNVATADSTQTGPDTDTNTVAVPTPAINVIKDVAGYTDADGSLDVSVGDTINYSYTVENKGTANLTNVTLSDDKLGPLTLSDLAGDGVGLIKAGASETATASYVVKASDLGKTIINVATADSTQTGPDTDTETVVVPTPALAIEKQILVGETWLDADTVLGAPSLLSDADGKVDYRFVISNTGTANLTNVVVSDSILGLSNFAVADLMTPGSEVIIDKSDSALLQRTWSAGSQTNTATADSVQTSPVSDPPPTTSVPTRRSLSTR
jgi:hypothetical protein